MVLNRVLGQVTRQTESFEMAAHAILSGHEGARHSRVISLDASRRNLQGLSLQQHELLMESLTCVERGLYRAAHVSAWQSLIDFLGEKLVSDGFVKLGQVRPKWPRFQSIEEVHEFATEHEQIVVAKDLKLLSKGEMKILHGMLSKRNECAHPGTYRPDLNESLGYVAEVINRIVSIQPKAI